MCARVRTKGVVAVGDEETERIEVLREGTTMALYISLSLLAVMAAVPTADAGSELALTVLLTSVGLVLAHQLAFRMSSRLFAEGSRLGSVAPRILMAQLAGGAAITLLAILPLVLFGPSSYRVSMALLLLFVLVVGYLVARSAPVSRTRALAYDAVILVLVVAVVTVKTLVGH